MKRIPLTKGKEALVDNQDYEYLMQWNWHAGKGGKYAATAGSRVFMHQLIAKLLGFTGIADHINRDGLDNQRKNLRPATDVQNKQNRGPQANNTSGFKGVYFNCEKGKWQAQITVDFKVCYLGRFDDKIEAAKVYNIAAKKHFGEFAWLNPIPGE